MIGRVLATGVMWALGVGLPLTAGARQAEPTSPATPVPATVEPPVIAVPTPTPTPTATLAPVPAPAPVPTAQPTPGPAVLPTPAATPRPRTPEQPRATPTSTPTPEPPSGQTPEPPPVMTPTPTPSPTNSPVAAPAEAPAPASSGFDWQPWLFGAAGLVLVALLWTRLRRERGEEPVASDEPAIAVPPPVSEPAGARLVLALRPVRAGVNMVTAVADCELTVTNAGDAPAEAVRVALTLVSAHAGQQARVEAINAAPITRTVVPAFALAPGEARVVRVLASTPLDQLQRLQANGREMLVPLVLVNVEHRDAEEAAWRTAQAFVVGVERVDSSKLAPLWLDTPRMFDQVAARAGGEPEYRRLT